ncbi:MAG: flippase [Paludibacteraceae bacterium]|nr:flippase [Paludibacteraceae bacterium]
MGINILNRYKNSEYKKEIHDTLWVMCLQGLNYLVPILVVPYLMVVLGAEKFGYYGFALAVSQWLLLMVDFGFNLSATKRIAIAMGNQDEVNKIFSSTMYAKIGLLGISFVILLLMMLIPQFAIYRKAMALMFIMVIGNAFFPVFLFQGIGKVRIGAIINGIAKISVLPLTFILVKSPDDYETAIILQGMVCIIAAIISALLIANKKWIKITKFKSDEVKEELKESWPLFLSCAATSIYTAMFIIILGFFATAEDVGQYSAADRLMRASCQLILFSTLQVFYPKVSRLAKEDRTAAVRLSSKLLKIITGLMIFIWAILFFGSTMIIELLGKDYKGGELLFRIMAFVPIFVGISGILGQCHLLALGNEKSKKLYTHTYFIAGGIAMLSVLILTSTLHGVGTAIALLITEIAVVINMGRGMRTI